MEIQKSEYLKNEKSFLDEMKNIFHSFWGAIIWWKIKICLKIVDPNFNKSRRFTFTTQQIVSNKHCCALWFVCTKIFRYLSQAMHFFRLQKQNITITKHSAERCISSPLPPSRETHRHTLLLLTLITGKYQIPWWCTRIRETEKN